MVSSMGKAANKSLYRYERKFVVNGTYYAKLEKMIKLHSALFSEIFYPRYINNIYFDNFNYQNFTDNVEGSSDRIKVRIRWYGDLLGFIEKPVLELKIKRATAGRKDSFKLASFTMDDRTNIQSLREVFDKSNLPVHINELVKEVYPTLLNRYHRKYFLSGDKNFRVTIDSELEYYNIQNHFNYFINKVADKDSTIIELKYAYDLDTKANNISTLFPFRMTKSSKYVNGVERILNIFS